MTLITDNQPLPVVEDMSTYVMGGRVTDASLALRQAAEAEQLGFRRVFIQERYNLKEAGVLLGGMAARTERVDVGTGAITMTSRSPILTAALGATLHSAFGPRAIIGLGRGAPEWNAPSSMSYGSQQALVDYTTMVRRLWRGETVTYDGPAGTYEGMVLTDQYDGPPPQLWYVNLGGPKAFKLCANPAFDGALVSCLVTPEVVHQGVQIARAECERIGRDPDTLRIVAAVAAAPDVDEGGDLGLENPTYGSAPVTFAALRAFLALSFEFDTALPILRRNGWSEDKAREIQDFLRSRHPGAAVVDLKIRDRAGADAMAVAELVPESWVRESCAIGSVQECVKTLKTFRDAGADEIAIYCSSPAQSAGLIAAWRDEATLATG